MAVREWIGEATTSTAEISASTKSVHDLLRQIKVIVFNYEVYHVNYYINGVQQYIYAFKIVLSKCYNRSQRSLIALLRCHETQPNKI